MMRTTIMAGVLCALAFPAAAESPPTTSELEAFCRTTTSLTPCSSANSSNQGFELTGHGPRLDEMWLDRTGTNSFHAGAENKSIQLAEAKTEPGLATALQEYIQELLGYKKPAKKEQPKEAEKAQSSDAPAGDIAGLTAASTGDLSAFLKQRATWGEGTAKPVKAPLAAGAPATLPTTATPAATDNAAAPIIHEAEDRPLPQLTAVPQPKVAKSLASLFTEREAWGTSPSMSAPPAGGKSAAATTGWSPNLTDGTTGNLEGLLAQRESWGTGKSKPVPAPLAAGASLKRSAAPVSAPEASAAAPIVHEAEDRPLPKVNEPPRADIDKALTALFSERQSWGPGPNKAAGPAASSAPTNLTLLLGAATLGDYLSTRDTWGKGAAAKPVAAPLASGAPDRIVLNSDGLSNAGPTDQTIVQPFVASPLPKLQPVSQADIVRARNALFKEREAWGAGPSLGQHKVAGNLEAFFKRRDRWGKGPAAKPVPAPLAAGAPKKLPLTKSRAVAGDGKPPIIHELVATPLPVVAPIPAEKISGALKSLFSERESWGTKPSWSGPRFAGDLERYFARRDGWGKGPKAKPVKAPLANGAPKKLALSRTITAPKDSKPPIVHDFVATPLPVVGAIAPEQIENSLKSLFEERESWGTEPKYSSAIVAGDLNAFLARRDRWGKGPAAKPVRAPLASGAPKKLRLTAANKPADGGKPPIIHELVATPLPVVGAIAPEEIAGSLKSLFEERASWGTEPSISGARFAGDLNRYFARRDGWGKGPKAKKVRAPLAAGASRKLRLSKAPNLGGNAKPPIIHEAQARPLPQLTAVPQGEVSSSLSALFKERESWGTVPSLSSPATASTASASSWVGPTDTVAAYLAARDLWNNTGSTASASKSKPATQAARGRCSDDLAKLANLRQILFQTGSAELSKASNSVLDKIAATIGNCADMNIRIEGHTDDRGSASLNQRLSQERAASVLEYLANAGIPRSRLSAVGFGEAKPVASNKTRASRARNRRIEFKIQ